MTHGDEQGAKDVQIEALAVQVESLGAQLESLEEVALARYAGYESELAMLRHEVLRLRRDRRKLLGRALEGD